MRSTVGAIYPTIFSSKLALLLLDRSLGLYVEFLIESRGSRAQAINLLSSSSDVEYILSRSQLLPIVKTVFIVHSFSR
jgi:hypothetical protein